MIFPYYSGDTMPAAKLSMPIKAAKQIFRESPSYESGASNCRFVRIDGYYGIKMYGSQEVAKRTYKIQRAYAKHGLAPNATKFMEFGGMFGYITQTITETLKDYCINTARIINNDFVSSGMYGSDLRSIAKRRYNYDKCFEQLGHTRPIWETFAQKIKCVSDMLGYTAVDLHWENVGLGNDGELLIIDFDWFEEISR